MEAAITSETSVKFYLTTWCNNPEGSHLHIRRCENLKSQPDTLMFLYCPSLILILKNGHQHSSFIWIENYRSIRVGYTQIWNGLWMNCCTLSQSCSNGWVMQRRFELLCLRWRQDNGELEEVFILIMIASYVGRAYGCTGVSVSYGTLFPWPEWHNEVLLCLYCRAKYPNKEPDSVRRL
jgi:hypothetical protein